MLNTIRSFSGVYAASSSEVTDELRDRMPETTVVVSSSSSVSEQVDLVAVSWECNGSRLVFCSTLLHQLWRDSLTLSEINVFLNLDPIYNVTRKSLLGFLQLLAFYTEFNLSVYVCFFLKFTQYKLGKSSFVCTCVMIMLRGNVQ